jgi:pilus assembly protein Flp/PilA
MKNTKGAALIEYGIIVGLISIVSIGVILSLGGEIESVFSTVNTTLESNMTAAGA